MLKKLFVISFFLSLSTEIFSEEYICEFEGPSSVSVYERVGSYFTLTSEYSTENRTNRFTILNETPDFFILTKTYPYSDIFVTIIDKNKKTITETYIVNDTNSVTTDNGTCLIKH